MILRYIENQFVRCFDWATGRYKMQTEADMPDKLESKVLYVIGESGNYWTAALVCPCGCKEVIQLSLLAGQRPRWEVRAKGLRKPTLLPSVHRTVRCKSHFFLRDGRIVWC